MNLWQIIERKAREQYGLDGSYQLRMADTHDGIDSRGIMQVRVGLSNGSERVDGVITLRPDERATD